MKMNTGVKEHFLHFDQGCNPEIMDFATNVVLKESKYIFLTRIKKQQYGYCTHCNTEFPTHLPKLTDRAIAEREMCGCPAAMFMGEEYQSKKHGDKMECPNCSSICTVRYAGLGHSNLRDCAYFVYYEKSRLNPKMIVARGFYATRYYGKTYKKVKTELKTEVYYTFEYKKIGKMIKPICESWNRGYHWGFSKSVHNWYNNHPYLPCCCSRDSIKEAVKDTPFAWSGWESVDHKDMVEFFDLYSRYPVTEYLCKLGYAAILSEKLERGAVSYNAINWKGKTIESVFRLSKDELRIVKQNNIEINSWFLHLAKHCKERLLALSLQEVSSLSKLISGLGEIDNLISTFGKYMSFGEALKYCIKQQNKSRTYRSLNSLLSDWRDYVAECKKLDMDTSDMRILFPNDLLRAHLNTSQQIRYAVDKDLTEKIISRLPDIVHLYYHNENFLIRPAESSFEIVEEGRMLGHCVGRYAKDHAEGKTDILFIRRAAEPDKSFFTVEVKENKIVQVRGFHNHDPEDETLLTFIEDFKKLLAKKVSKIKKDKSKIPA